MILDMNKYDLLSLTLLMIIILEAVQRLVLGNRSKQTSKELKCYNKALHELFKAVTSHPQQ